MNSWQRIIADWQTRYGCEIRPPASQELIEKIKQHIGPIPLELLSLYEHTNGLACGWFNLLPIETPDNIKHTWDGILRANDPYKTKFVGRNTDMLKRFLVFASIGAGECAVFDRADSTIWYEEEGNLHQTDLSLQEFIETCLKEVQEI
jgi:SMI1/KNR4 family protein SUKH-1